MTSVTRTIAADAAAGCRRPGPSVSEEILTDALGWALCRVALGARWRTDGRLVVEMPDSTLVFEGSLDDGWRLFQALPV